MQLTPTLTSAEKISTGKIETSNDVTPENHRVKLRNTSRELRVAYQLLSKIEIQLESIREQLELLLTLKKPNRNENSTSTNPSKIK